MTSDEWSFLSRNYDFDTEIKIRLNSDANDLVYSFTPDSCQLCLTQHEMRKYKFENQKIFIRLVDDENPTTTPLVASGVAPNGKASSSQPTNNDVIVIGSLDQTPNEKATKNSLPDDIDTEESVSSLSFLEILS